MTAVWIAGAIAGLILVPFGGVSELVKPGKTWRGFDSRGAVLTVARAERVATGGQCDSWLQALRSLELGKPGISFDAWGPWTEEERGYVTGCDSFPCEVKLDRSEVGKMKTAAKDARMREFERLVRARVLDFRKTQSRKDYEFPGPLADPWKELERRGFRSATPMPGPEKARLWTRKLDLVPGKLKPLRQVLETRFSSSGSQATLWVRDDYTSHYFDSWGEWTQVVCEPERKSALVVQALVVELDLLKNTDIISRLGSGKMRELVEEYGSKYLDGVLEALKARANSSKRGAPRARS